MRAMRAMTGLLTLGALLAVAGCLGAQAPQGSARAHPAAGAPTGPPAGPAERVSTEDPTPSGWGPTLGELAWARAAVDAMTPEEQAAAVLMPGFWGHDQARPAPVEARRNRRMHGADTITEAFGTLPYSGVFLRPEVVADAGQVARLATALHAAGDGPDRLPLLVAIDQEGGVVQRLKVGVDAVPSAASVGATGDVRYARTVARANGRALRRLGVTMVFAPVADVDPDGRSAIGTRAYSPDTEVATDMVVATLRGYLASGVLPVVKHFPGLGSVTGDSHRVLPVQPKSLAALRRSDLRPFAAAVAAGAPVVMTGHTAVQRLDPGVPASLSPAVIGTLLRDDLGFEGVAVTDSQGMGPIHGVYGPGEGAVRSLLAGNDLVLNSPRPDKALGAVLAAVQRGRLPRGRLAEAATRVTALRAYQQRLARAHG